MSPTFYLLLAGQGRFARSLAAVRAPLIGVAAVLAVLAAVLAAALGPSPALAQAPGGGPLDCDAAVVDTSGLVDVEAVDEAAAGVLAARVVVRAFQAVTGGLHAQVDEIVATCYTPASGQPAGELALLSFSIDDRQALVVLGSDVGDEAVADRVAEAMTARFPGEDYTGGLLLAIDELAAHLGEPGSGSPPPRPCALPAAMPLPASPEPRQIRRRVVVAWPHGSPEVSSRWREEGPA